MVSKLTKNPEKRSTGMAVTGPTKVATFGNAMKVVNLKIQIGFSDLVGLKI